MLGLEEDGEGAGEVVEVDVEGLGRAGLVELEVGGGAGGEVFGVAAAGVAVDVGGGLGFGVGGGGFLGGGGFFEDHFGRPEMATWCRACVLVWWRSSMGCLGCWWSRSSGACGFDDLTPPRLHCNFTPRHSNRHLQHVPSSRREQLNFLTGHLPGQPNGRRTYHGLRTAPRMPVTDEDAALAAFSALDPLSEEQQDAKTKIDQIIASEAPFIDIHELFPLYNILYFRSLLLPRVEVCWSARLTLCAGICELVRDPNNSNKFTRIRLKLSEPLLKYRSRSDVINTLLHEAIHAYLFITTSWRHSRGEDGDDAGHGPGFLLLSDAINDHGGYDISVFHTFHDEVDSYRTHIWQCDGPCKTQAPFFGLVKRAMNRAPGRSDGWWAKHQEECGGVFTKIAEPELTKAQVEKLSGLERAGRQRNKIDGWVVKGRDGGVGVAGGSLEHGGGKKGRDGIEKMDEMVKKARESVSCPICSDDVAVDEINGHLDRIHPP